MRPDVLDTQWVRDPRQREQFAASALRAQVVMARVGPVERQVERQRKVAFALCGVVSDQVGELRPADRTADPFKDPRAIQQLLAERTRAAVVQRDQGQTSTSSPADSAREQRPVGGVRRSRDNRADDRRDKKSKSCCTDKDAVKVEYKMVVPEGAKYPEPEWYVWIESYKPDGTLGEYIWVKVPSEKIVVEYSPSGQAYVYVIGRGIQCFVRPQTRY